jgi:murein DD-endopeptidase MepM/ murein hydrolase activator NlpD
MKDFKYSSNSLRSLKRELDRAFGVEPEPKKSINLKKISKIIKPSLFLIAVIGGTVLLIFATSRLFSNDLGMASAGAGTSFIGKHKVETEFRNMENSLAKGGDDISTYRTEDPYLKLFFYRVKQGESVYSISRQFDVPMDTLISLNSMNDAHTIGVGDRLLVPNMRGILYTVKDGDTIEKIAKEYDINADDIVYANEIDADKIAEGLILFLPNARLSEKERARALGHYFTKPLRGRFTSGYGMRRHPITRRMTFHTGIDIAAPTGTPIAAAREGRVVFAGWKGGYGKVVVIRHQFGYETWYAHMSTILVRNGQYVQMGQRIGRVGNTGVSTGPHLHFEVRRYGRPTNPLSYHGLRRSGGRYY